MKLGDIQRYKYQQMPLLRDNIRKKTKKKEQKHNIIITLHVVCNHGT